MLRLSVHHAMNWYAYSNEKRYRVAKEHGFTSTELATESAVFVLTEAMREAQGEVKFPETVIIPVNDGNGVVTAQITDVMSLHNAGSKQYHLRLIAEGAVHGKHSS